MCVMMISSKKNNYQLKIFLQVKILKTTSHCAAELNSFSAWFWLNPID